MDPIEFELVDAKGQAFICVSPKYVELIVDVTNIPNIDPRIPSMANTTQITMTSGTKFFVKESYQQVKQKLLTK